MKIIDNTLVITKSEVQQLDVSAQYIFISPDEELKSVGLAIIKQIVNDAFNHTPTRMWFANDTKLPDRFVIDDKIYLREDWKIVDD